MRRGVLSNCRYLLRPCCGATWMLVTGLFVQASFGLIKPNFAVADDSTWTENRPATASHTWGTSQPCQPTKHEHHVGQDGTCNCPGCQAFAAQVRTGSAPDILMAGAQDFSTLNAQETLPNKTDSSPSSNSTISPNDRGPSGNGQQGSGQLNNTIRPMTSLGIDISHAIEGNAFDAEFPEDYASRERGSFMDVPSSGTGYPRLWPVTYSCWIAPSFRHRPLYFEEPNLERYGHYAGDWRCQSVLSAAHFFGTIPTLPYQLGAYHPCDPVTSLGYGRPGNCNPHVDDSFRWSTKGAVFHSLGLTGLVFLAL